MVKNILIGLMMLLCASACLADELNINQDGLALKGYDAVAYINDGKAVQGSKEYSYKWKGATWQFSTPLYREVFTKDPERYLPQYGGYCAFAMARGQKTDADPKAFTVVDGKLYLHFSQVITKVWRQNSVMFINQADIQWKKFNP